MRQRAGGIRTMPGTGSGNNSYILQLLMSMEVSRHKLAGHAVPQGTLSRLRRSPCEYIPVRSMAASMRPTVPQAYAG